MIKTSYSTLPKLFPAGFWWKKIKRRDLITSEGAGSRLDLQTRRHLLTQKANTDPLPHFHFFIGWNSTSNPDHFLIFTLKRELRAARQGRKQITQQEGNCQTVHLTPLLFSTWVVSKVLSLAWTAASHVLYRSQLTMQQGDAEVFSAQVLTSELPLSLSLLLFLSPSPPSGPRTLHSFFKSLQVLTASWQKWQMMLTFNRCLSDPKDNGNDK